VQGGQYWISTKLPGSLGSEAAKPTVNYGGYAEVLHAPFWPSNPAGVPRRDHYHKAKLTDEWWYIKRGQPYDWQSAAHTVGTTSSIKQSFRAGYLKYNARISFPYDKEKFEETCQNVRADQGFAENMQNRYDSLMKGNGRAARNTAFDIEQIYTATLSKDDAKEAPTWRAGGTITAERPTVQKLSLTKMAPRRPKEAQRARAADTDPMNVTRNLGDSVIDPPWATKFNNEEHIPRAPKKRGASMSPRRRRDEKTSA